MSVLFYLLLGLAAGFVLAYVWMLFKAEQKQRLMQESQQKVEQEKIRLQERLDKSVEVFQGMKLELEQERGKKEFFQTELSAYKEREMHWEEKWQTQRKELDELQQKFTAEFKALAGDILKENSLHFSQTQQKQMQEVLNPLKEKIQFFEKRVNDVHTEETKQRSELKQQIVHLMDASKAISQDAQNLTKALKGDTKTQGNWGEMILQRILESSGLSKGTEYFLQYSDTNQEGKRIQPDAVILLPDQKNLIIDSKVSLVAYEKYVSEENTDARGSWLKEHVLSIRNHIKNLHSKDYFSASQLKQPDFILLFMPIEGAFSLALQEDQGLYQEAWEKNIVIVSPTTLLATLKTVDFIWTQEKQTKNALEIARQAGNLYEKFVSFLQDLQEIDKGISKTKLAYEEAKKKLMEGRGNLVSRVENLRLLGAKTSEKLIPSDFLPEDL